jgi:hypothetical protein
VLSECRSVRVLRCQSVAVSECCGVRVLRCHSVAVSECCGVRVLWCQSVMVSECRRVRVLQCHMADTFQESLPDGLTVIPVILGSDKTMLSTLGGDKSVWPVYLSISNLTKAKQPSVKSNGLILIGLLPRDPNCPKTLLGLHIKNPWHQCFVL